MSEENDFICRLDYNRLRIPKKVHSSFLRHRNRWKIAFDGNGLVIGTDSFFGVADWPHESARKFSRPVTLKINRQMKLLIPSEFLALTGIDVGGVAILVATGDHFKLLSLILDR